MKIFRALFQHHRTPHRRYSTAEARGRAFDGSPVFRRSIRARASGRILFMGSSRMEVFILLPSSVPGACRISGDRYSLFSLDVSSIRLYPVASRRAPFEIDIDDVDSRLRRRKRARSRWATRTRRYEASTCGVNRESLLRRK